jgi:hypothetical protein
MLKITNSPNIKKDLQWELYDYVDLSLKKK